MISSKLAQVLLVRENKKIYWNRETGMHATTPLYPPAPEMAGWLLVFCGVGRVFCGRCEKEYLDGGRDLWYEN